MRVHQALADFVADYEKSYPDLEAPFDAQWRSPCEIGQPYRSPDGDERIRFQPRRREPPQEDDFAPLERALEITVHPDVKAYFGAFWSAGLEAEARDGHVSLILLWNDEDVARLNENLIGHALAKQQARKPMTVFFACTEPDSELFLSVDNTSGAVLLEKPGYPPQRQVAGCLAEFLEELVPAPPSLHP